MARTYKLDHYAKGTGASVVPVDEETKSAPEPGPKTVHLGGGVRPKSRKDRQPTKVSTALPPGHVRKKSTGEIGKVQSVDPKAGTATVLWLRQGRASTVSLDAITRR
jgi:hypothetical protein